MLAQLSARLRARQAAASGDGGHGDGDGGPAVMIDDNCEVSSRSRTFLSAVEGLPTDS